MLEDSQSDDEITEALDDSQNLAFRDIIILYQIQKEGSVEKSSFSEEDQNSLDRLTEYGLVEFQTVASEKESYATVYRLSDSLES